MPAVEVARVVIEFTTTHAVGTGEGDGGADSGFVRDPNGLPTLPGTSIGGVLRHALEREAELADDDAARDRVKRWFGFQDRRRGNDVAEGQASRLRVSFACAHGTHDRPLAPLEYVEGDAVANLLHAGVLRDHVRIRASGVADAKGHGKFDTLSVPAGARFTFELCDTAATDDALSDALSLLAGGGLRLGGKGTRGQGEFKVVSVRRRKFDFGVAADRAAWGSLRSALHVPAHDVLPEVKVAPRLPARVQQLSLRLRAVDFWMFGGGSASSAAHDDAQRQVGVRKGETAPDGKRATATTYDTKRRTIDMLPLNEPRVRWTAGGGVVDEGAASVHPFVATGVKGALRHRASFWARAAAGDFADGQPPTEEQPASIRWLLGNAAAAVGDRHGTAGRLTIGEALLAGSEVTYARLDHVSLDRFTQGPFKGALYSEAPLYGGTVEVRLLLDLAPRPRDEADEPAGDAVDHAAEAVQALNRALRDLGEERLAVGAGGNRGHGYFRHEGPIPQFKVEA